MNLKEELQKVTNIQNVKENRFLTTPSFPYIVYHEEITERGADNINNLIEKEIYIFLYEKEIDKNLEQKIVKWLNSLGIKFEKNKEWINEEKCYEISYEFNILEKKEDL